MGRGIRHTFYLGLKEFVSLGHDPVLIFLILYSFTLAIYLPAKGAAMDVVNASVAVVDEDHSILSQSHHSGAVAALFSVGGRDSVRTNRPRDGRGKVHFRDRDSAPFSARSHEGPQADSRGQRGRNGDESGRAGCQLHQQDHHAGGRAVLERR